MCSEMPRGLVFILIGLICVAAQTTSQDEEEQSGWFKKLFLQINC